MAYSQHEWVNGEIITAEKLNNMEAGIANNDTREIAASATASVANTTGAPSCEVTAEGSVASIAFDFAFKGIKGEQGIAAGFGDPSATATTLEPGADATAAVTASGEDTAKVFGFSFGIPKGEKGDTGERGEKGETGEKGAQGIKGEDGVTPLLQKGESAIQVSYDSGEQWQDLIQLDDIKGEKGDTGEQGEKGEDAPTITACEINIAGSIITGKLSLSNGGSVDITGTYTAEGDSEPEGETEPDNSDGGNEENPDNGDPESDNGSEGETEPDSGGEGD